jgi:hypothetical protein
VSPTHEGRYADRNCTVTAKKVAEKFTGQYEWLKSTSFVERGTGGGEGAETRKIAIGGTVAVGGIDGPIVLTSDFIKCEPSEEHLLAKCHEGEIEERVPINIECSGFEADQGGVYSTKSAKEINHWKTTLIGCQTLGMTCNNTGSQKESEVEELILNEMKGVLGYTNKAAREVGISWSSESGKDIADFTCGEAMRLVLGGATEKEDPFYTPKGGGGAFITAVTPIDQMVGDATASAVTNTETAQNVPNKFEGKGLNALEDYFFNPSGTIGNGTKWSPAGITMKVNNLRLCQGCLATEVEETAVGGEGEIKA